MIKTFNYLNGVPDLNERKKIIIKYSLNVGKYTVCVCVCLCVHVSVCM